MTQTLDTSVSQVIVGDFNFHSRDTNLLKEYFETMELCQLVKTPTHVAGRILDHAYVSKCLEDRINVDVQFKYYSDHAALHISLDK